MVLLPVTQSSPSLVKVTGPVALKFSMVLALASALSVPATLKTPWVPPSIVVCCSSSVAPAPVPSPAPPAPVPSTWIRPPMVPT